MSLKKVILLIMPTVFFQLMSIILIKKLNHVNLEVNLKNKMFKLIKDLKWENNNQWMIKYIP